MLPSTVDPATKLDEVIFEKIHTFAVQFDSKCDAQKPVMHKSRQLAKARELYEQARGAGDRTALTGLGTVYLQQGQIAKARELYEQARDAGSPPGKTSYHPMRRPGINGRAS